MRQLNSTVIKQYNRISGVTLIELVIALTIFSLMVLAFSNIDTFSRYHLLASDKRAKLQNDASYVLEHMAKNIGQAIGNTRQAPAPVDTSTISGDRAIRVWVDYNLNGKLDTYPTDRQVAYRFTDAGGNADDRYQIWYYDSCVGPNCNQAGSSSPEIISRKIYDFSATYSTGNNYVEIQIKARWSPGQSASADNPEVSMQNRIYMPSVATN